MLLMITDGLSTALTTQVTGVTLAPGARQTTKRRESGSTVRLCRLPFWPRTPRWVPRHMPARACASLVANDCRKAGRIWSPQSHAAVLWTRGIRATGRRFLAEEYSNRPAPGITQGSTAGEGRDRQSGPSPRRFHGRPWRSRIPEGRRTATLGSVGLPGELRKS